MVAVKIEATNLRGTESIPGDRERIRKNRVVPLTISKVPGEIVVIACPREHPGYQCQLLWWGGVKTEPRSLRDHHLIQRCHRYTFFPILDCIHDRRLRAEELSHALLGGQRVLVQLAGILERDAIDRHLVKIPKLLREREL